ncbi:hypothetical protein PPERSA_10429 [Pseudocohnilembus persalinus]|uniref:Gamma-glutamylcyclotransferase family protein n=1 Tax=Pseudocohnilembus persalinus TaxID=266149 RepID=A0A0V0QWG2_PSEPJ|nr:hypothetical protein PPERSA_10429 [Pseudocohnilembus persalinus]|eukprot:KRX06571.1 hypothetical protein PPERSA_10429 [Pseudocohnilembus persalinus]
MEQNQQTCQIQKQNYHIVFTYGTLKKGYYNHKFIKDAVFVTENCYTDALQEEKYTILIDKKNYVPFLYKINSLTQKNPDIIQQIQDNIVPVQGELYIVNDEQLKQLDILEGIPTYYDRFIENFIIKPQNQQELQQIENKFEEFGLKDQIQNLDQSLQNEEIKPIKVKAYYYLSQQNLDERYVVEKNECFFNYTLEQHKKYVPKHLRE